MEVPVYEMFFVVVLAVTVLRGTTDAGYIYPRPNVAFELPKELPNFQDEFKQRTLSENVMHHAYKRVVSYSVPLNDYYFSYQPKSSHPQSPTISTQPSAPIIKVPSVNILNGDVFVDSSPTVIIPVTPHTLRDSALKNHPSDVNSLQYISKSAIYTPSLKLHTPIKQEKHSPFNLDVPNIPTINIKSGPGFINHQSNLGGNTFSDNIHDVDRVPTVNLSASINHNRKLEFNTVHYNAPVENVPIVNVPSLILTQNNLEYAAQQFNLKNGVDSYFNLSTDIQKAAPPKITKHIYFHVPPPEIEEPVVKTTMPRKTIYKIIIIKGPSQETKKSVLRDTLNQASQIEDKTIIYVLSKKLEAQQLPLPNVVPSEHEVFFVGYSGNPGIDASQINDDVKLPESELFPTSNLQSRLVNEKR